MSLSPTVTAMSSPSTQTINSLFGARLVIPGTGIIPNNYMFLFDPHPGLALSLMPGKSASPAASRR